MTTRGLNFPCPSQAKSGAQLLADRIKIMKICVLFVALGDPAVGSLFGFILYFFRRIMFSPSALDPHAKKGAAWRLLIDSSGKPKDGTNGPISDGPTSDSITGFIAGSFQYNNSRVGQPGRSESRVHTISSLVIMSRLFIPGFTRIRLVPKHLRGPQWDLVTVVLQGFRAGKIPSLPGLLT